ncbi:hypothetical protein ACTFIW_012051 [Dictyostelium discoideum]
MRSCYTTGTSNVEGYQRIRYRLLIRSINRRFNKRRMFILLVKLGFKLNLEKSVLEPTQSMTLLLPKKACWFKGKANRIEGYNWDQSFPIPQDVKSEISHWLTVLNQWNGKEISLFPSYDYVLTTDAS